jgi:hypothetical protein
VIGLRRSCDEDSNKEKTMSESATSNEDSPGDTSIEARQRLVASVAGSVAAGIVTAPSKKATTAAAIAEIAVDIAEEIVKKVGL